jgi:hypothetical protein
VPIKGLVGLHTSVDGILRYADILSRRLVKTNRYLRIDNGAQVQIYMACFINPKPVHCQNSLSFLQKYVTACLCEPDSERHQSTTSQTFVSFTKRRSTFYTLVVCLYVTKPNLMKSSLKFCKWKWAKV